MENHLPSGGNVLWLDGTVTMVPRLKWAGPNLPYHPEDVDFIDPYEAQLVTDQIDEDRVPARPHVLEEQSRANLAERERPRTLKQVQIEVSVVVDVRA